MRYVIVQRSYLGHRAALWDKRGFYFKSRALIHFSGPFVVAKAHSQQAHGAYQLLYAIFLARESVNCACEAVFGLLCNYHCPS